MSHVRHSPKGCLHFLFHFITWLYPSSDFEAATVSEELTTLCPSCNKPSSVSDEYPEETITCKECHANYQLLPNHVRASSESSRKLLLLEDRIWDFLVFPWRLLLTSFFVALLLTLLGSPVHFHQKAIEKAEESNRELHDEIETLEKDCIIPSYSAAPSNASKTMGDIKKAVHHANLEKAAALTERLIKSCSKADDDYEFLETKLSNLLDDINETQEIQSREKQKRIYAGLWFIPGWVARIVVLVVGLAFGLWVAICMFMQCHKLITIAWQSQFQSSYTALGKRFARIGLLGFCCLVLGPMLPILGLVLLFQDRQNFYSGRK